MGERNVVVWNTVKLSSTLLESTSGKDKVLKLIQYSSKTLVESIKLLNQISSIKELISRIPPAFSSNLDTISRQFDISRKLYRFGRTLDAFAKMRGLLNEKNQIVQFMGMMSLFFNATWFMCDHVQYLHQIKVLESDPLLRLNKVAVVVMQAFHLMANIQKMIICIHTEQTLRTNIANFDGRPRSRSGEVGDLHPSTSGVFSASAFVVESLNPEERRDTLEKLQTQLRNRLKARIFIWLDLIKNIGDLVLCFDFGFDLKLPPFIPNASGVISSIAGLYLEYLNAVKKAAKAKA